MVNIRERSTLRESCRCYGTKEYLKLTQEALRLVNFFNEYNEKKWDRNGEQTRERNLRATRWIQRMISKTFFHRALIVFVNDGNRGALIVLCAIPCLIRAIRSPTAQFSNTDQALLLCRAFTCFKISYENPLLPGPRRPKDKAYGHCQFRLFPRATGPPKIAEDANIL